jgi:hypothetical protein
VLKGKKKNCGTMLTAQKEEVARADIDAAFESACRVIVTKSLPGWIEEICAEHLLFTSTHLPRRLSA